MSSHRARAEAAARKFVAVKGWWSVEVCDAIADEFADDAELAALCRAWLTKRAAPAPVHARREYEAVVSAWKRQEKPWVRYVGPIGEMEPVACCSMAEMDLFKRALAACERYYDENPHNAMHACFQIGKESRAGKEHWVAVPQSIVGDCDATVETSDGKRALGGLPMKKAQAVADLLNSLRGQ